MWHNQKATGEFHRRMIAELLSAGVSGATRAHRGRTSTSKVFRSTSAPSLITRYVAL
jgi:hypothetical protein